MGNINSSARKKSKPTHIKKWKLDYSDEVLIDANMQIPVYMPLDEMDQPSVEEDMEAVWVPRHDSVDESYLKPIHTHQTSNITMETVLAGAEWTDFEDCCYDAIGEVLYASSEDVIALIRFQTKLQVFRKVIVVSIDIYKILPHLSFVEYPYEFRRIAKRNKTAAVELLMERLLGTQVVNHWRTFVLGLNRCGYEHIAMILDVDDSIDSRRYPTKYISIMADTIKTLIVPTKVTRYLWGTGVLNTDAVELINAAEVSEGIGKAVDLLLDKIQHRHTYWYSHFVDALKHADLTDAVELLDIPELHIVCDGSHRYGSQLHSRTSLTDLPCPPPPPWQEINIRTTQLHSSLNATQVQDENNKESSCLQSGQTETYSVYDMETDLYDPEESYDDTAVLSVITDPQISVNTMTKIVYVPEGHTMSLRFEGEIPDAANYSNDSVESAFVQVHSRDITKTEMDDQSSIGFVQIEGLRNHPMNAFELHNLSGKRLFKPPYPLPAETSVKRPPLPPRNEVTNPDKPFSKPPQKLSTDYSIDDEEYEEYEKKPDDTELRMDEEEYEDPPPPLPPRDEVKVKDLTEIQTTVSKTMQKCNDESYRQANHTHPEKRKERVDDVQYKDEGNAHDDNTSGNTDEDIHTEHSIVLRKEAVDRATPTQIREQSTDLNELDITSVHTLSRDMLTKHIEQLKHEQNDERESTELLNKLADEMNNLSTCKENKIEALKNIQKADTLLKTHQAELESVITPKENAEDPSDGIYSARQLEAETGDTANLMRTLLMAVILNNSHNNETTTQSPIPLARNSFRNSLRNSSSRRLPKASRSSFRDSAFYSCSNIGTIYEAPGLD